MTRGRKILWVIVFSYVLLQISCKDVPVEPLAKNPREYTFTIDTLTYPGSFQTLMKDIYANDAQDIWAVGYNDAGGGKMYHYNGKQWVDVKLYLTQGGTIIPGINLNAIHGFSPVDIWAVGERWSSVRDPSLTFLDSSSVIHYDGREWTEQTIERGRELFSVWGSVPTDVWAGGLKTLYRYDGIQWRKQQVSMPPEGVIFLSIAGTSSSNVYMIGSRLDVVQPFDTIGYYLYHFNGSQWNITDSSFTTGTSALGYKFGGKLFVVDGTLFSAGYGIFRNSGSFWERMIQTEWSLTRIQGLQLQNLFAVGAESQVYHYNGFDWYRYFQFSGLDRIFTSVWTTGEEVFIIGHDGRKTYVVHGK